VSFGKVAWGLLSAALAFVLNTQLKPSFERNYAPAENAAVTGTLTLRAPAVEIPLMTLHLTTLNVEHLGKSFKIRELLLRAAADSGAAPAIELFVRLPEAPGDDLATGPHNPSVFRQVDLAIAPTGRLGRQSSCIVIEQKRVPVLLGTLTLTDVAPLDDDAKAGAYHALGRFELQVESSHGMDLLSGRLDGQLVWDDDRAAAASR
jgi:hypothetical protein